MRYMGTPLSIRFDPEILERLRHGARGVPGATPSALAQRLVDEGLRMAEHPGVVFRDGPTGRRAALTLGPDVWEVIKAAHEVDRRGSKAIIEIGGLMNLPAERVEVALRYYTAYPQEIDTEIQAAETASRTAEKQWHARQKLLA